MSLSERLFSKFRICSRNFASWPNVHFSDNFSAAGIISRHINRLKGFICYLPPQGFGTEARTRGGTLAFPAYIHTRTKNIFWKSKKCVCSERIIPDLTRLGAHGGLGQYFSKRARWCRVLATTRSRIVTFQLHHLKAASNSIWRSFIYQCAFRQLRASRSSGIQEAAWPSG